MSHASEQYAPAAGVSSFSWPRMLWGCPCHAHSKTGSACCSGEQSGTASQGTSQEEHVAPKPQAMGHKNDLIVWLQLHPAQRHVYEASMPLLQFMQLLEDGSACFEQSEMHSGPWSAEGYKSHRTDLKS